MFEMHNHEPLAREIEQSLPALSKNYLIGINRNKILIQTPVLSA